MESANFEKNRKERLDIFIYSDYIKMCHLKHK